MTKSKMFLGVILLLVNALSVVWLARSAYVEARLGDWMAGIDAGLATWIFINLVLMLKKAVVIVKQELADEAARG